MDPGFHRDDIIRHIGSSNTIERRQFTTGPEVCLQQLIFARPWIVNELPGVIASLLNGKRRAKRAESGLCGVSDLTEIRMMRWHQRTDAFPETVASM
jgi:hypothetical protein